MTHSILSSALVVSKADIISHCSLLCLCRGCWLQPATPNVPFGTHLGLHKAWQHGCLFKWAMNNPSHPLSLLPAHFSVRCRGFPEQGDLVLLWVDGNTLNELKVHASYLKVQPLAKDQGENSGQAASGNYKDSVYPSGPLTAFQMKAEGSHHSINHIGCNVMFSNCWIWANVSS